jgi:hypothetical protein
MMRHLLIACLLPLTLMSALLCMTCSGLAQSSPTEQEVKSVLKDAEYALRRFDEVTSRIDFSRWAMEKETLATTQKAFALAQIRDVQGAKDILAKLDGTRKPSSTELLDIVFDLEGVGMELTNLSTETIDFQDENTSDVIKVSDRNELATDLARASSTAQLAMARVWSVLRKQVEAQEAQLLKCQSPSASRK